MSDKEDDATRAAREWLDGEWQRTRRVSAYGEWQRLAEAFRAYGEAQRRAGAEEARAGIVAWLRLPGNKPAVLHARDFADMIERHEDTIESHADERGEPYEDLTKETPVLWHNRGETEEKCGRCGGEGSLEVEYGTSVCGHCLGTGKARKP